MSEQPENTHAKERRPRAFTFTVVLIALWFAIGGALGPLSGKLSEVQSNNNNEFLPAKSETLRAQVVLDKFAKQGSGDVLPMTVVLERESGSFTPADIPALQAIVNKVIALPSVKTYITDSATAVFPATPEMYPLAFSKDGKAFVFNVNLSANELTTRKGSFEEIGTLAADVQKIVDAPDAATKGYVTGLVGIFAEFAKAFAGIDGILLLITLVTVAIILIVVYRSPMLWIIPLISAIFALSSASGLVYFLAKADLIKLNGQSQGIMTVLVFGAATDYALLLISRYREELRHVVNKYDAMRNALKAVWEPIAASAGTVIAGLLCLQLSELKSNAGLGPVGALGIACSLVVSLTFLPALLVVWGRKVFWPFVPHFGSEIAETKGIWGKVARGVGRRARSSWVVTGIALLACAALVSTLKAEGVSTVDTFTDKTAKPLVGLNILEKRDLVPPSADVTIVTNADRIEAVMTTAKSVTGVDQITPRFDPTTVMTAPAPIIVDGKAALDVTFKATESATVQQGYVEALRQAVHAVSGADALVGGNAAANYDVQISSRHDRQLIIPIILLVISLILMLLLRSILAPLLLVATVVLSFAATLGVSAFVFNHVFNFAGADTSFPLFAFVFLVALGIDYNIFLMTRVREESIKIGTRPGTLKALAVTGGVITSAGIVLAATFAVLGVLPLVFLAELGFAVAFGVLLDTLIVRSVLVPALTHDIGKAIWWPSKLAKQDGASE